MYLLETRVLYTSRCGGRPFFSVAMLATRSSGVLAVTEFDIPNQMSKAISNLSEYGVELDLLQMEVVSCYSF